MPESSLLPSPAPSPDETFGTEDFRGQDFVDPDDDQELLDDDDVGHDLVDPAPSIPSHVPVEEVLALREQVKALERKLLERELILHQRDHALHLDLERNQEAVARLTAENNALRHTLTAVQNDLQRERLINNVK